MPTPGTTPVARVGEMISPGARHHRLNGVCPDRRACTLPVHCSQLCSRLESAEITAEMRANVRARQPGTKKAAA